MTLAPTEPIQKESPISIILNHMADLHNSLTLGAQHLDNAWKRYHEIMIEIAGLREEMEESE